MLRGIQLRLLLNGKRVDKSVIETLADVQIKNSTQGPGAFQLVFELMNSSRIHNQFLFSGSDVRKETRVAVAVSLNASEHVLMDGVVTNHQLTPAAQPGLTTLTLTGEDLTRVLDYEEKDGRAFPNQSLASRVKRILSDYSGYRITPMVKEEKFRDVDPPGVRVPHQRGTDLDYIRTMAQLAGHVFYFESPQLGQVSAYWGPEYAKSEMLPSLSVDLGVATNVDSMNFSFDSECLEEPLVERQNQADRSMSSQSFGDRYSLNEQLGKTAPPVKRMTKLRGTGKYSAAQSKLAGLSVATRSNNAVTAKGSLDTLRYNAVLKPRRRVDVRGATQAFNGTWVVRSVTHTVARGVYRQDFELVRNSLSPLSPKVKKPNT